MNYLNLFDIIWYYLSLYESVACVYSVHVYLRLLGPKDEVRQLEGDTAALAAEPANPSLALVRKGYWKSNVWQVVAMTAMISHDMPWLNDGCDTSSSRLKLCYALFHLGASVWSTSLTRPCFRHLRLLTELHTLTFCYPVSDVSSLDVHDCSRLLTVAKANQRKALGASVWVQAVQASRILTSTLFAHGPRWCWRIWRCGRSSWFQWNWKRGQPEARSR